MREHTDMALTQALDTLRGLGVYELAGEADVSSPDGLGSPGAVFLANVRDAITEAIEYDPSVVTGDDDGEVPDANDMAFSVADSQTPIYTHELFTAWTDLCLWGEDQPEREEGETEVNLENLARWQASQVAERLCQALIGKCRDEYASHDVGSGHTPDTD